MANKSCTYQLKHSYYSERNLSKWAALPRFTFFNFASLSALWDCPLILAFSQNVRIGVGSGCGWRIQADHSTQRQKPMGVFGPCNILKYELVRRTQHGFAPPVFSQVGFLKCGPSSLQLLERWRCQSPVEVSKVSTLPRRRNSFAQATHL